jgi:hypothetical protein
MLYYIYNEIHVFLNPHMYRLGKHIIFYAPMAPPEPMVGRAPEGQAVGAASMGHVKKSYVQITSNGDVI